MAAAAVTRACVSAAELEAGVLEPSRLAALVEGVHRSGVSPKPQSFHRLTRFTSDPSSVQFAVLEGAIPVADLERPCVRMDYNSARPEQPLHEPRE